MLLRRKTKILLKRSAFCATFLVIVIIVISNLTSGYPKPLNYRVHSYESGTESHKHLKSSVLNRIDSLKFNETGSNNNRSQTLIVNNEHYINGSNPVTIMKGPLGQLEIKQVDDSKVIVAPLHNTLNGGMLPHLDEAIMKLEAHHNEQPLIPAIIHQTWDTYNAPSVFIPWIKSVVGSHPTWQYLFWTQADLRCYFKHKHPEFLEAYNSYRATIFQTDVMRYFILYDYGGFYLDLDVEALKPLDIWRYLSPSILTHETYEQVFLLKDVEVSKPNVMTTVLSTRAYHPYYLMLQQHLIEFRERFKTDVLRATGPHYMQAILDMYNQTENAPLPENDILLIHPDYWLPTFDPLLIPKMKFRCANKIKYLKRYARELCNIQKNVNFVNQPSNLSYLNHHWIHTNLKPVGFKEKDLIDVRSVIPNFKSVPSILNLTC